MINLPSGGSGVYFVIPAIFKAAEFTWAMWPLACKINIGLSGQILSKFSLETSNSPWVTVGSKSWPVIH